MIWHLIIKHVEVVGATIAHELARTCLFGMSSRPLIEWVVLLPTIVKSLAMLIDLHLDEL